MNAKELKEQIDTKIGKLELMNLINRDKIGRTSFPYFFRRVSVLRKGVKND